ncbi:hypothetical protein PInf_006052 [Phytophthora infestans]|nr:hypothetical protein PInf_006052 [Phytophthora infestans]
MLLVDIGTALTKSGAVQHPALPSVRAVTSTEQRGGSDRKFDRLRSYLVVEERIRLDTGRKSESDAASPVDDKITDLKIEEEKALTTPVVEGFTLRHNDVSARMGGLHVIVGNVGSGKPILLAGILGDAAVALVPWQFLASQNETMCTNITFELPCDADKYEEALRPCGLKACFKKSLKGKLVLLVAHSLSFS